MGCAVAAWVFVVVVVVLFSSLPTDVAWFALGALVAAFLGVAMIWDGM